VDTNYVLIIGNLLDRRPLVALIQFWMKKLFLIYNWIIGI